MTIVSLVIDRRLYWSSCVIGANLYKVLSVSRDLISNYTKQTGDSCKRPPWQDRMYAWGSQAGFTIHVDIKFPHSLPAY